ACALPHVTTHGCGDGGCTIVECEPRYVDCDGDAATVCEPDFRIDPGDARAGAVVSELTPTLDGDGAEWSALALYPMNLPCTDCLGSQPGGQNGEPILKEPPDATDL